MKPINYAVIGSGWRSLFYIRLAKAYPQYFRLAAVLCRTEEKAEYMRKEYMVHAVTDEAGVKSENPDFLVVAVNKDSIFQVTRKWALKGYPVLCETPAAMKLEDLYELWHLHSEEGMKIQVAEQYFLYPAYQAALRAVEKGYLGDPYMVSISAAHDYHGASLIRSFLGVSFQNMKVFGKEYTYPVVETDSRYGLIEDGRIQERGRIRLTFEFEGGKTAFYDFSGVQYHSKIRSRHLNIQGPRGELDDWVLRWVDEVNRSQEQVILQNPFGDGREIKEILLDGKELYRNPFYEMGEENILPQDETAIGAILLGMRRFIEDGTEVYPFSEALQDAYIRLLMEKALRSGETEESETQPWADRG